ncbi:MAG: SGNH/GDSL hydrolase family protein [Clostridia bacterium]|nr:SGNH/GDSL hydrolase family protein [Clostridia bacterium]
MRLDEIDKNLKVETTINEPDLIWLDAKQAPFALYGVFYDEEQKCYVRMPQEIADAVSRGVGELNRCTAGGRIRFRTNSPCIAIRAVQKNRTLMPHITLAGQSGFDLYRKNEDGEEVYYATFMPPMGMKEGYSSLRGTDGAMAEYTINFPLYDGVCELYIALKKDAVIEEPTPYAIEKPIVYYGSSITQGGCASRPGNAYQGFLSRWLDADHINLGFSGAGRAEPAMVEHLANLCKNASAFVCDYDHNAPDLQHLKNTHLPLYRAVRAANPSLPILFVSAPDILLHPDPYRSRQEVIRESYETAKAEGDEKVWLLAGDQLLAGKGWDGCTVDGCHPNDFGFFRMAAAMEPYLTEMLKQN